MASPHRFHNLGEIAFDPGLGASDPEYGLLYIGAGDFGSVQRDDPGQLQRLDTVFGAVLRIAFEEGKRTLFLLGGQLAFVLVGWLPAVVLCQRPLDARGAGHGPPRRGESHHEAVAQRLHLVAAVLLDLLAHQFPLGAQYLLRGFIAPTGRQVGGAFDVREQDGDCAFGKLLGHDS